MRNILIAIATSFVLFCLSAGTSYYLNQPLEIETPDEEVAEEEQPTETVPDLPIEEMTNQMPVARRPDQALTIEAVRQMTEAANRRQEQLDEFEQELKKEEKNVQVLYEDLKREREELSDFGASIDAKLQAMDAMNVRLNELLTQIETQKKELETLEKKTGVKNKESAETQQKIKDLRKWYESMDAELAAKVLKEQADQGELELVAGVLHSLESRQQAKVLSAIEDPALLSQLMDALEVQKAKKGK